MAHPDVGTGKPFDAQEALRLRELPASSSATGSPLDRVAAAVPFSITRNAEQSEGMQDANSGQIDISAISASRTAGLIMNSKRKDAPGPELIESLKTSCNLDSMFNDREKFSMSMDARAQALVIENMEKYGADHITTPSEFIRCRNQAVREYLVSSGVYPPEVMVLTKLRGAKSPLPGADEGLLSSEANAKIERSQAAIDALLAGALERSLTTAITQVGALNGHGPSARAVRFLSGMDSWMNRENKVQTHNHRTLKAELKVFLKVREGRADERSFWLPAPWREVSLPVDEHGARRIKTSSSWLIPIVPINHLFNEALIRQMVRPLSGVLEIIGRTFSELQPLIALIANDAENSGRTLIRLSNAASLSSGSSSDAIKISSTNDDSFELSAIPAHREAGQVFNEAFQAKMSVEGSDFKDCATKLKITSPVDFVNYIEDTNRASVSDNDWRMAQFMVAELTHGLALDGSQHAGEVKDLIVSLCSYQALRSEIQEVAQVANKDGNSDLHVLAQLPNHGRIEASNYAQTRLWIDTVRHLDKYLPEQANPGFAAPTT